MQTFSIFIASIFEDGELLLCGTSLVVIAIALAVIRLRYISMEAKTYKQMQHLQQDQIKEQKRKKIEEFEARLDRLGVKKNKFDHVE